MTRQQKTIAKKRGRPATGQGLTIGVRCHPPLLREIDVWRSALRDKPKRSEAIRRLV